jgi:hypothetical protein
MNILNEKKKDFKQSTNFKFLTRIYGNSINNLIFVKFIISVKGGHYYYSPRTPKNPATPLTPLSNRSLMKPVHVTFLQERWPEAEVDSPSETNAEDRMRASIFSLPHMFIA